MNHGARQVTWIPVSGSVEDSANNETIAGMIVKQSAIFIDDGDVHRLVRVLRNADGTGMSSQTTFASSNQLVFLQSLHYLFCLFVNSSNL